MERNTIAVFFHVKVILKKRQDDSRKNNSILSIDVYCGKPKIYSCIKTFIRLKSHGKALEQFDAVRNNRMLEIRYRAPE